MFWGIPLSKNPLFVKEIESMSSIMSFLRLENETPSQLHLVSADRRLLIMVLGLLAISPFICLGVFMMLKDQFRLLGIAFSLLGLLGIFITLFFAPYKSEVIINSGMRTITNVRHYWLGESIRENIWAFNEITDANFLKQGFVNLVDVKTNKKIVMRLNFGGSAREAIHAHNLMQSWLKGLTPESDAAATALQEMADEKQIQQSLKNAEKMLYYFGGFSLLGGLLGFFTDQTLTSTISITTILGLATGILYLACGFGAKHKIEAALWIAIVIVLAE
jgi:hypothetical protein